MTLLVTGCSLFPTTERIVTEVRYVEIPIVDRPAPVSLNNIKLYVVTQDNYQEFLDKFTRLNGEKYAYVAISVKDYENLSLNIADLKRYIDQQQSVIVYYEDAIKNQGKE